jgi:hypothetical protein
MDGCGWMDRRIDASHAVGLDWGLRLYEFGLDVWIGILLPCMICPILTPVTLLITSLCP